MQKVGIWNYETKDYDDYDALPDGATPYVKNLEKVVACASCGLELPFGQCYTSKEIQIVDFGIGFAVCEKCYTMERERDYADYKKRVNGK